MGTLKMILLVLAIASLLGIYLSYVNSASSAEMLLLFIFSGVVSTLYVYLFSLHDGLRLRSEREQSLIGGLYEFAYCRSKRKPITSSIMQASKGLDQPTSALFLELSRRIRFGEEISAAFDHTAAKVLHHKFDWLGARISSEYKSIQNFLNVYEGESKKNAARAVSKAQTFSTVSMFISTILPAFIIFSFIGNAVISSGSLSFFTLSVLMLVAIPAAYTTISVAQNGGIFKN